MFLIKTKAATALILTLAIATVTFGQQSQPTPAPRAEKDDGPVETQGFKGKIFEVKHRDPSAIARAVANLGSGFKGSTISYNQDFKTITVRDFPENIAAIEEAIKRLDAPQATAPDIEFRMHLLIASNAEGATSQFPSDLGDVIKQLQSTLNYKSYHLVSSIVHRAKEGDGMNGRGEAQLRPPLVSQPTDAGYGYELHRISIVPTASGPSSVQIRRLNFNLHSSSLGQAAISSEIGLRDGEKVVVGTASLRDKAMVLVLTARVIK